MPREGVERIILKLKGGEKQLSRRVVPGWEVGTTDTFTQRIFLASPGGTYLAWADTGGALRVRGGTRERVIAGAGGGDVRFSVDERFLAAARASGAGFELLVVDLASGEERVLGTIGRPEWMEWVVDGVVVSHAQSADKLVISYLPVEGEPVQVASGTRADLQTRFTTARRGHRAMYFFQKRAFVVDVRSEEAVARQVGELAASVENVEMAPDGSEAALVIAGRGIMRWKDGGELAQLAGDAAHTIWYSADGSQLAWAAMDKAAILLDGTVKELPAPSYDLNAMRFHGDELVVSIGSRALLWNPKTGARNVIGKSGKGQTVQAADVYRGGVVLWTREMRRTDRPVRTVPSRARNPIKRDDPVGLVRAQKNAAIEPFALAD